MHYNITIS